MTHFTLPTSERIDIGGYRLNFQRLGNGKPAAIFDTGLGVTSLLWSQVLPLVGQFTTGFAYDRAGYGGSDPAPADPPRTSPQMVRELRLLLQKAEIAPPYILVGHSFGAINMLCYALNHPDEVAGMVLVEPSHPQMFTRVPAIPSSKTMARSMGVMATLSRWGLIKAMAGFLTRAAFPRLKQFSPELRTALIAMMGNSKTYAAALGEAIGSDESFRSAVRAPGSLGDLPLVVLTADSWVTGKQTAMKRGMVALREEQAQLSSRGEHRVVEGCDHADLPLVRADAVVEAIKKVRDEYDK
jgi:pimeloyl-ACP methyl ester carboxylesterase